MLFLGFFGFSFVYPYINQIITPHQINWIWKHYEPQAENHTVLTLWYSKHCFHGYLWIHFKRSFVRGAPHLTQTNLYLNCSLTWLTYLPCPCSKFFQPAHKSFPVLWVDGFANNEASDAYLSPPAAPPGPTAPRTTGKSSLTSTWLAEETAK